MAADRLCEFLEWDSAFFQCRIGRVRRERLLPDELPQIEEWCRTERIACLYLLAASDDAQTVRLAEDHGFRFVDIRVTFEKTLQPLPLQAKIRRAQPSDLPYLRQIARKSFRDSRFYYDSKFDESRCDELYATWIEKSCNGYADCVLVAEEEQRPAGWITCHFDSEKTGRIGLIAVDSEFQGRGLGKLLVNSALHLFSEQGMTLATVVTQGRNIRSQRLYQKCGFLSRSVQLWYHRWSF